MAALFLLRMIWKMTNKDKVGLQIRVPEELRDLLHKAADRNGMSLNDLATEILAYEVGYELPE